ncbi:isopentenyl-diphosphate Delta-isomerase [Jannaschia seohaensis]|uniref:Isopentenyl-diphosphate Delta-isomerase n=1 Tax=Jannaschia seohaensis TaxID=475081 RepID=A0A2Y9C3K8_9RHOB|nr:isopentenyl-diphosphate Delta-isomerase [Jannaschia seohaensis]PWJ21715.1 isopentenyl-diphosphate delta-isomerase [Jannaschia seohaensis]SSA37993.1 isopentenyl-diphosphate delta-isomerase [Jannaschia seohaensis]
MSSLIPAWVDGKLVPVDKLEVHERGLRHPAVSVFVMEGSRVLIQRRALSKYHTPGLWANTCCTHPHWGEATAACASRRLEEELGITGLRMRPRGTLEYRADVGGGLIEHEVVDVFTADAPASLSVTPHPDEVDATRWVDLYDLAAEIRRHPGRFTPWLRIYMTEHMDSIFGVLNRA